MDVANVSNLHNIPLDSYRDAVQPSADNSSEMEQVGAQFESVFISMLIKEMRESTEDGLFPGEGSDSYGALFDMYLGQHMAEHGGIGIKQMLVARYAEQSEKANADEHSTSDGEPGQRNETIPHGGEISP